MCIPQLTRIFIGTLYRERLPAFAHAVDIGNQRAHRYLIFPKACICILQVILGAQVNLLGISVGIQGKRMPFLFYPCIRILHVLNGEYRVARLGARRYQQVICCHGLDALYATLA